MMRGEPHAAPAQGPYESRCLETLRVSLRRTRMYEKWRALDPGEGAPIDVRYSSLPYLTKADIRRHFPDGVVPRGLDLGAALAAGTVSFVSTSGTADEAITNIWNQEWWDASERASWALNSHASRLATGGHREAILASALSVGPRSDGPGIPKELRTQGRFFFLNEFGSTVEWPPGHEERILAELSDYAPEVLEANPSLLAKVSRWAARSGRSVFQPPLITLTYEFPSAVHLRQIRAVFKSPIVSSYGSTEAGYVFMECERGRLHQNTEFCRVDLLPVSPPGADGSDVGRILVTTFHNKWFPLLRFEIGDLARLAPAPCPCGRSAGFTLQSIEGRYISLFVLPNGRVVTHGTLDRAIAQVKGVDEYRIDQDSPSELSLRAVVSEGNAAGAVLRDARDSLHGVLGDGVNITAEAVPRLMPEKSGKYLLAKRNFPIGEDGARGPGA
jgi:phenylacetate-coenzyme A ligase PaaK-like adenylate-forming protein